MPGKTKPTKDLSGHVAFTAEESYFYTNMERKRLLIERARAEGTLVHRKTRNPIMMEKTPRKEKVLENFHPGEVPEQLKKKERWVYEESDATIMSKFNSQKNKFAAQAALSTNYNSSVDAFNGMMQQRKDDAAEAAEAKRKEEEAALGNMSARSSARSCYTARSDVSGLTARSELMEPTGEVMTTAAMKFISSNNPEVCAKVRAERAAKYVGSLAKPIYPPTYRPVSGRDVFKPSGSFKIQDPEELVKKKGTRRRPPPPETPLDTSRLKESLGQLMEELESTNNELARQELKIALNNKTKGYERPKKGSEPSSARSTRSARSTGRR